MKTNKKVKKFLKDVSGVENESLYFDNDFNPERDIKGNCFEFGDFTTLEKEVNHAIAQAITLALNDLTFWLEIDKGKIFLQGFGIDDVQPIFRIPLTEIVCGLRECDKDRDEKWEGEREEMVKIFTKVVSPKIGWDK